MTTDAKAEWYFVDGRTRPVRGFEKAVEQLIRIRRRRPDARIHGPYPSRDSALYVAAAAANP